MSVYSGFCSTCCHSQYGTCGQQCTQESAVHVARMCPQTAVVRAVRMCPQTRRTPTATLKLQLTEFLQCISLVCGPDCSCPHVSSDSQCTHQYLRAVVHSFCSALRNVHVAPDCSIRAEGKPPKKGRRPGCSTRAEGSLLLKRRRRLSTPLAPVHLSPP